MIGVPHFIAGWVPHNVDAHVGPVRCITGGWCWGCELRAFSKMEEICGAVVCCCFCSCLVKNDEKTGKKKRTPSPIDSPIASRWWSSLSGGGSEVSRCCRVCVDECLCRRGEERGFDSDP